MLVRARRRRVRRRAARCAPRLREALAEAPDDDSRVDVLTRLAGLNTIDHGDPELVELLERELADETDPRTRVAVEIATLDSLMMLPGRHDERARRVAAIDLDVDRRSGTAPSAARPPRRGSATRPARPNADVRARWRSRRSKATTCSCTRRGVAPPTTWRCVSLDLTDHVDEARTRDRATARRRRRSRLAAAARDRDVVRVRARAAQRRRREAENDARMVFDLVEDGIGTRDAAARSRSSSRRSPSAARSTRRTSCWPSLGLDGPLGRMTWEVNVRHARARLALAEGDYELALADAIVVGDLREEQGRPQPDAGRRGARLAARALAHLGRRDEAVVLADDGAALARRFGAPIPIAGAMHARAVAEADDAERDRAVPTRARRCAGHARAARVGRVAARARRDARLHRQPRRGARGAAPGAGRRRRGRCRVLLAERARRELVATGLRPRQAATRGRGGADPAPAPDLRARRRRARATARSPRSCS